MLFCWIFKREALVLLNLCNILFYVNINLFVDCVASCKFNGSSLLKEYQICCSIQYYCFIQDSRFKKLYYVNITKVTGYVYCLNI